MEDNKDRSEAGESSGSALAVIDEKTLALEVAQRGALSRYVRDCMVEGSDYGAIPGTKGKTLLKPGAEKLCGLFKCSASFEIIQRREDEDTGLWVYDFRCDIHAVVTGYKVAEGYGSASSFESKWRTKTDWVNGRRSKRNRTPDEMWEVRNTVLKMAKKRALVDAAILLGRCSDIFTQDMEDVEPEPRQAATQRSQRRTEPRPESRREAPGPWRFPYPEKHKGKLPSEIEKTSTLMQLLDSLKKSLANPEKAKFHAANQRGVDAIEAEIERRLDEESKKRGGDLAEPSDSEETAVQAEVVDPNEVFPE